MRFELRAVLILKRLEAAKLAAQPAAPETTLATAPAVAVTPAAKPAIPAQMEDKIRLRMTVEKAAASSLIILNNNARIIMWNTRRTLPIHIENTKRYVRTAKRI